MSPVIAVANQKGGVGKTTTAVNLSAALGHLEKETLLVDIDPQGNATSGLGLEKKDVKACIYDVLINGMPMQKVIMDTCWRNLKAVPATIQLAGAEIELVPIMSREKKLREAVDEIRSLFEYIIIDCPPSLGLLTLNALTAADSILIPIQCEYYALEGLGQLMNTINLVKKYLNHDLHISGVVMTMYDSRTNLAVQVSEEVKAFFNELVYSSVITRNVRLSEAPSHGKPIIEYDPKSRGSEVYLSLAHEVIER